MQVAQVISSEHTRRHGAPHEAGAETVVTSEVRQDGVCLLTLDAPGHAHVTITAALGAQLEAAVLGAERDGRVRAIVLRSAKPRSFLVGANLAAVQAFRFARDAEDAARAVSAAFLRIAHGTKPVVACVEGAALGGGFELALACTATVATDSEATSFALPEVKLGLLPAGNGLLRVAERAGLRCAIDLGLTGRSLRAREALALGLVDDVVAPVGALEAASRFALRLTRRPALRRALPERRAWLHRHGSFVELVREGAPRLALEGNPLGRKLLFRRARLAAAERTRGHHPAAARMLDVLARYGERGFDAASQLEATHFGELVVSETSRRLVELFFALTAVKKDAGVAPGEQATPRHVDRVAVVGAGLIGAGLAYLSAQAGATVSLKDTDEAALARGLKYTRDLLDERVARGTMTSSERDRTFARLWAAGDDAAVSGADLVFEAVFEDLAFKAEVLRALEAAVTDTCVIATNTSSLTIARIAEGAQRPERIVGVHTFSPVHRTELMEVVRTKVADPGAIATVVAFARRQKKTVIVVGDGPGFYTTRILVPLLTEAVRMLGDGLGVEVVDAALVDWGFALGPLHHLDELGIDAIAHAASALAAAFGPRHAVPAALTALRVDDRRGKKNGRGFYLHAPRGEGRRVDPTVYRGLSIAHAPARMPDDISLRATLSLVNEAVRCLDEGILRSPRDGDVGAVAGVGFPAFRGGPFRYVDILGAPEVVRRLRSLEQRFGERFAPAPLLVEMARRGQHFYR